MKVFTYGIRMLAFLALGLTSAAHAAPAPQPEAQAKQLVRCSWLAAEAAKMVNDAEAAAVYQALADILDSRARDLGASVQMRREWAGELESVVKQASGNKELEQRLGQDMQSCDRLRREVGAEAEERGRKAFASGRAGH